MARTPIDQTLVEIRLLGASDDLRGFTCADPDLDDFLHDDADRLHGLGVIRLYLAIYDRELAGYVALLNDVVSLKAPDKKKLALQHDDHPAIPAVKIARLAVAASFREMHHGLGKLLVRFSFDSALGHAAALGCRLLTVDAYHKSVGFYEKLGFSRNKLTRSAESAAEESDATVSMRLDLHMPPTWIDQT